MKKNIVTIDPITRSEGGLKVNLELLDGSISRAYVSATMFRGIEFALRGRDATDSLVITPRICGICGTSHLTSSVRALESLYQADVPSNGALIRDICLGVESVMSNFTNLYIMFAPDLLDKRYFNLPGYDELVKRFTPFRGGSYAAALRSRKRLLEIIALFGGQWPHSHFMVPGGVTCRPTLSNITKALAILAEFQKYLEKQVFGCNLDRFLEINSFDEFKDWLEEPRHGMSDLGSLANFSFGIGLDEIGSGVGYFLSYGEYPSLDAEDFKAGFFDGKKYHRFKQEKISEHSTHSFYSDGRPKHPFDDSRHPISKMNGERYSWSLAPRYDGRVVEVGPLARQLVSRTPLFMDVYKKRGPSVFLRILARFYECSKLTLAIGNWLNEIEPGEPFYKKPTPIENGKSYGLTEAPRGSLGHWCTVEDSKIKKYQVITPTTWNASPRDSHGVPGAIEQALEGVAIKDEKRPIEAIHVVRSFDPCMACSVHVIKPRSTYWAITTVTSSHT